MARWLTDHEHSHRASAVVHCLMLLAWRDFDAFTSAKVKLMTVNFHREFALKDKEKLSRPVMEMADFACILRHHFFNDA